MEAFNFSPFPNLVTERLILRQMTASDADAIFRLRSNEAVLQYINIQKAITIQDAHKFIDSISRAIANNESILWAMALKSDLRLIGTICLWNIIPDKKEAEIGYMLDPEYQGAGLMMEAVQKVVEYGFETLRLNAIVADLHPDNARSLKVLERMGFVYTGTNEALVVYTLAAPLHTTTRSAS